MGRKMWSALTLPKCHRLSSSTRCLTATCAAGCKCCILHPPQAPACKPKWGQPGCMRCAEAWWMWLRVPNSQLLFLRWMLALTRSNGKAPSTNTTLPSLRWAMPWASMSKDSIHKVRSSSVIRAPSYPSGQIFLPMGFIGRPFGQGGLNHGYFSVVLLLQHAATHFLEAAIHEVSVHDVSFAVTANIF